MLLLIAPTTINLMVLLDLRTFLIILQQLGSVPLIHRIHKWRTRGKKLVPSHESEALEGKQKLQMKTFSELAECLARIPPKITLYGRLFKYNDVGHLLLLTFGTDLLFAIKRDAIVSNKNIKNIKSVEYLTFLQRGINKKENLVYILCLIYKCYECGLAHCRLFN